jgi:uncharacterized protein with von Willebrand factor type A (vWA) domain
MRWTLSRFAEALRSQGIAVSAAELIDAARAVQSVDGVDRETVRSVLAATLIKRREDEEPFERAFTRTFVVPPVSRRRRRKKGKGGVPSSEGGLGPRANAVGSGSPTRTPATSPQHPRSGEPRRTSTVRSTRLGDDRASTRPSRLILSPHRRAARPERTGRRDRDASPVRRAPEGPAGAAIADRPPGWRSTDVARKEFRERWTAEESHRLALELARLIARLELRFSRRLRRSRRGQIAVHRILRANIGYDSVPFRLVRQRARPREPRLLLLVDVSHSVRRAAAALLGIASKLAHRFRSVRVYFFVDRAVDVTAHHDRRRRRGGADEIERVLAESTDLNTYALSDYGRVFYDVYRAERGRLRRDTLVLILGDGRTNHFDPAVWTLEEIHRRTRRIAWLVTEPRREWDTGDSAIGAYAPSTDFVCEAADLVGLEHAITRVLARS